MSMTVAAQDVDAVVIGAGFSGLYALHRLRDLMGMSVRGFEAGDGVGGTWYWNRYPGARCDSDSYLYCYTFDKEMWKEWNVTYTERYPEQPEILDYLESVAKRWDIYRDFAFNTRVCAAVFDEGSNVWRVTTDAGETVTARFVVAAVGSLSAANTPEFPGADSFAGESYHTGHWPHRKVDFTGKRVAVIGTGASGVQAIPVIAAEASDLTVFQRTANYILPARNGPIAPEIRAAREAGFETIRDRITNNIFGLDYQPLEKGALESSDEEIERELMKRWNDGGFGVWVGAYLDMFYDDEANAKVRKFLAARIREKVNDPATAELLVPKGYPFGVKRVPLDSGYFETFNSPHVHLVDVASNPVAAITPTGLRLADGAHYGEFDAIVYATGFDALTAPFTKIDFRGRGGASLKNKWTAGPRTYLGLMSAGFPNLFTITGPQSPSVLSNMPVSIQQHVEFVARIITEMVQRDAVTVEPLHKAEDAWVTHNQEVAEATLFTKAATWYMGANIPGKPRLFLPNIDFVGPYRAKCDAVADNDYEGFAFDAFGTTTQEAHA
jgi:cyclohexanone monooxygenase